MPWWFYLILALALLLVVLPLLGMFFIVPIPIFSSLFERKSKKKWSQDAPSDTSNEEMVRMWKLAKDFQASYRKNRSEVHVLSQDGLNLYGEYYKFGGQEAVIILPGRPETLVYSLFYAESYRKAGVNVLVIDTRAHGKSDGELHGCGYMERYDIYAFIHYLVAKQNITKVILHGICVGSSACVHAAVDPDSPSEIAGLVTDGLYVSFYETLWLRVRRNAKIYPKTCVDYFRHRIKKLYGYDIKKDGPLFHMQELKIPTLMMASEEDIYSLPEKTRLLYSKIPESTPKKLVLFPHGAHSHLRIVNPKLYDQSVQEFVSSLRQK